MNFENINYSDYEIKTPYPKITTTQKDEKVILILVQKESLLLLHNTYTKVLL